MGEDLIPEIEKKTLSDSIERAIIDSYEKLCFWINSRFAEQKERGEKPKIDLANLVIILGEELEGVWVQELCGKVDGIINLEEKSEYITIKPEKILFEVKYPITFENSIIYNSVFNNTKFYGTVCFQNTAICCGANFMYSEFLGEVCFLGFKINQDHIDEIPTKAGIGSILFQNITFYGKVHFHLLQWTSKINVYFNCNVFERDVKFVSCSITAKDEVLYDFSYSTFRGKLEIEGDRYSNPPSHVISNLSLNGSHFYQEVEICGNIIGEIKMENSHFYQEVKIWGNIIGKIIMKNSHFYDTVNITLNKYNSNSHLDFSLSTIQRLFFIDSGLEEEKGESINLSNEISFSKSIIKEDAFILIRNINNNPECNKQGTLNFQYANILGTITIQDSKLSKIILGKTTFRGSINIENVDANYDCRESITKIKNEYISRNDTVNSLIYKAKELESYIDELNINKYLKFLLRNRYATIVGAIILPILLLISLIPIKSVEKLREYTLLYFNKLSNSFGVNWGQGILFTCITAWVFFVLINELGMADDCFFEWGWNSWDAFGEVWIDYLRILNVLNFNDILDGIKLNAVGETLFFLSKIFVAYGIYQTISAFRKYGK